MKSKDLLFAIDHLAVFHSVHQDPAIAALRAFLEEPSVASYSNFVSAFYPVTSEFTAYVRDLVLNDDNFYVKAIAAGDDVSPEIQAAVKNELNSLEKIASITPEDLQEILRLEGNAQRGETDREGSASSAQLVERLNTTALLAAWSSSPVHLAKDFADKLGSIHKTGYGAFAKYTFFRIADGELVPVAHPDYQRMDQLFGYERERNLIIKNTEALVNGTGASNMLLYGDMGTGKSSTIKAVAAAYSDQGLRIVEVKKNQLFQIPELMETLAPNPLKFILFIDDLSFASSDDNFSALKAVLEGSIAGCGDNTVIYATSNRRHLVREMASDRYGAPGLDEDMHVNDTLQETMSLAARFGLTITFQKPNKEEYLAITDALAAEYGVEMDAEELHKKAEAFAIRRNGRSPRTAKQFIELLKIGL